MYQKSANPILDTPNPNNVANRWMRIPPIVAIDADIPISQLRFTMKNEPVGFHINPTTAEIHGSFTEKFETWHYNTPWVIPLTQAWGLWAVYTDPADNLLKEVLIHYIGFSYTSDNSANAPVPVSGCPASNGRIDECGRPRGPDPEDVKYCVGFGRRSKCDCHFGFGCEDPSRREDITITPPSNIRNYEAGEFRILNEPKYVEFNNVNSCMCTKRRTGNPFFQKWDCKNGNCTSPSYPGTENNSCTASTESTDIAAEYTGKEKLFCPPAYAHLNESDTHSSVRYYATINGTVPVPEGSIVRANPHTGEVLVYILGHAHGENESPANVTYRLELYAADAAGLIDGTNVVCC